jgi:hypothetical protein
VWFVCVCVVCVCVCVCVGVCVCGAGVVLFEAHTRLPYMYLCCGVSSPQLASVWCEVCDVGCMWCGDVSAVCVWCVRCVLWGVVYGIPSASVCVSLSVVCVCGLCAVCVWCGTSLAAVHACLCVLCDTAEKIF